MEERLFVLMFRVVISDANSQGMDQVPSRQVRGLGKVKYSSMHSHARRGSR